MGFASGPPGTFRLSVGRGQAVRVWGKNHYPSLASLCGWLLSLLLLLPLPALSTPHPPKEESASLLFQQRAGAGTQTRVYVVQKGDWLIGIVRTQLGMDRVPYPLIRRLNPQIRNLNRIYPGQRLRLPVQETPRQRPESPAPPPPAATYRIQAGDSLGRILADQLGVPTQDLMATYEALRRLNPGFADPQNLPAGESLVLPAGLERRPAGPSPMPSPTPIPTADNPTRSFSESRGWLEVVQRVLSRMKGSLLSRGNYVIPIEGEARLTIDCASLPLVELDDGTTVLLDFRNLISPGVREAVRRTWPSHHFLSAEELADPIACLRGITARSKGYRMTRTATPLRLGPSPETFFRADWLIESQERPAGAAALRLALLLYSPDESPLPAEALAYLEELGISMIEIGGGRIAAPPATLFPAPVPSGTDPGGLRGIALAERLLVHLGASTARSVEVPVFTPAQNGFQLSITADLLASFGGRRYLLQTRPLPEEFLTALRQRETRFLLCDPRLEARPLLESLLTGLDVPFSAGVFSFRLPETQAPPRLTVSFPALRVVRERGPLYLVDFPVPPALDALFSGRPWGRLYRY